MKRKTATKEKRDGKSSQNCQSQNSCNTKSSVSLTSTKFTSLITENQCSSKKRYTNVLKQNKSNKTSRQNKSNETLKQNKSNETLKHNKNEETLEQNKNTPLKQSRNLKLEEQLKIKFGIKELSIVLYDHLYDTSIPLYLRCFLSKKRKTLSEISNSVVNFSGRLRNKRTRSVNSKNSSCSTVSVESIVRKTRKEDNKQASKNIHKIKNEKITNSENVNNLENGMIYNHEEINNYKDKKDQKEEDSKKEQSRSMPIIDDIVKDKENGNYVSAQEPELQTVTFVVQESEVNGNYSILRDDTSHNLSYELHSKYVLWALPGKESNDEKTLQNVENNIKTHDSGTINNYKNDFLLTEILGMLQEETVIRKDSNTNNNYIHMTNQKEAETKTATDLKEKEEDYLDDFNWLHEGSPQMCKNAKNHELLFSSRNDDSDDDITAHTKALEDLLGISSELPSFSQSVNEVPEVESRTSRNVSNTHSTYESVEPLDVVNNTMGTSVSNYFSTNSLEPEVPAAALFDPVKNLPNSSAQMIPDENTNLNAQVPEIDHSELIPEKGLPKIVEDIFLLEGSINLSVIKNTVNAKNENCGGPALPSASLASSSSLLALTVDNLSNFNKITNQKPADNVVGMSGQENEASRVNCTSDCNTTEKSFRSSSRNAPEKRKWVRSSSGSYFDHATLKKVKLNRSRFARNTTESVNFDKLGSPNFMGCSPTTTEQNFGEEHGFYASTNNFDAKEVGTSKEVRSADWVRMDFVDAAKSFSGEELIDFNSTETMFKDVSKSKEELNFGQDSGVPVLENRDKLNVSCEEARQDVKEIKGNGNDAHSNSVKIVAAQSSSQKKGRSVNEDCSDGDIIQLFVDDDDLIFLNRTEGEYPKPVESTANDEKINENESRLNDLQKETVNDDARAIDNNKRRGYDFDFNLYVKNNAMECDKALELMEESNTNTGGEIDFSPNLPVTKEIINSNVAITCAENNEQEQTVDVGQNQILQPLMALKIQTPDPQATNSIFSFVEQSAETFQVQKVQNENNKCHETVLNQKCIYKIFFSYCFRYLRYGNCFNTRKCLYKHNTDLLLKQIQCTSYRQYLAIFEYLIQKRYFFFARNTYVHAVHRFSNCNQILELYERLIEGHLANPVTLSETLNAFTKVEADLKVILKYLVKPVSQSDVSTLVNIIKNIDTCISEGEFWSTLKPLFLKFKPGVSLTEKIMSECVRMDKDLHHLEDVNTNVLLDLPPSLRSVINQTLLTSFESLLRQKRAENNSADRNNRVATIASPDFVEKNEQWKAKRLSEVEAQYATCTNVSQITTEVPGDGTPFAVQPIDGLSEPSSVYRDRFWKFYVDVYRLKEGLRHEDYNYVIEILDTYMNTDQPTLIARSFYNILRAEIKRSQYHLNNVIRYSVLKKTMATLSTVVQVGRWVLNDLVNEDLWVLAHALRQSLEPYDFRLDAEFVLLSAQIYIANCNSQQAFALLKHHKIICTNRCKWRVSSSENDDSLRVMVISLLLISLSKVSAEHALFLFEFLIKDQPRNYSPVDLTRYTDTLMTHFLSNDCVSAVERMTEILINYNFTLNKLIFRTAISYLYDNNKTLGKQLYQYGIGLGVYNEALLSYHAYVIINVSWTEGEQHYSLMELFKRLTEDSESIIDRLKNKQLQIFVIFEKCSSDYPFITVDNSKHESMLVKYSKKTFNNILKTRFKPPIKLSKAQGKQILKLQGRSVMNYLKNNFKTTL